MKLEQFFIPSNQADARLEIVAAKPQHQGPNPTIVFNHGSTGRGHNKALYSRTVSPAVVADYFTARGWMVLFPQRRAHCALKPIGLGLNGPAGALVIKATRSNPITANQNADRKLSPYASTLDWVLAELDSAMIALALPPLPVPKRWLSAPIC